MKSFAPAGRRSAKSGGTRTGIFQRTGREHHSNELRFRPGTGRAFEKLADATNQVRVLDLASGSGNLGNHPGAKIAASASHRGRLGWHDSDNHKRITQKFGVGDRFKFIGGDLLNADFGDGYDVATLGHFCTAKAEIAAASC